MSPTFLELTIALVLLVVAWQLGVALAPHVFRKLRELQDDIDGVSNELETEDKTLHGVDRKDHSHGTHR